VGTTSFLYWARYPLNTTATVFQNGVSLGTVNTGAQGIGSVNITGFTSGSFSNFALTISGTNTAVAPLFVLPGPALVTNTPTNTPTSTITNTPTNTPVADAFAHIELPGSRNAPASNEATMLLGSKLTLDLRISGGSNAVIAQQSYMTFTNSILQNVEVASSG